MAQKLQALLAVASLWIISSCSSGGASGAGSQASVTVPPTVQIKANVAKAIVNQVVTITWSSTGVTSCTLAGDTTGTVGASGQKEVQKASAGNINVEIICTGPGGSASGNISVIVEESITYSVSTTTPVAYPDGYMIATTDSRDIQADPCNLDLPKVTYPKAWLGNRPLPRIVGAPFPAEIGRAIMIKDIMLDNNPAFVLNGAPDAPNGCNLGPGALKGEIDRTVHRLKQLGVQYVSIPQWHWATIKPDGSYDYKSADSTFGPLSDANLAYFVNAVHAAGMKAIMTNQIQGFVDQQGNNIPTPAGNMDTFRKWLTLLKNFSAAKAPQFQALGIDVWELGCSFCLWNDIGDGSKAATALFASNYLSIARSIKLTFKGKLMISGTPWLKDYPELLREVDIIQTGFYPKSTITQSQSDALTVDLYKKLFDNGILYWADTGKTVMVVSYSQSRADVLTKPGYLEETVCTGDIPTNGELVAPVDQNACVQRKTTPDFSLQATVHQANMEMIKASGVTNLIVMVYDYWATDTLTPQTAFPNIATSIRNKPAEGVVRQWFAMPK